MSVPSASACVGFNFSGRPAAVPPAPRHRSYGAEVMPEQQPRSRPRRDRGPRRPGSSLTALFFAHHGLIWRSDRRKRRRRRRCLIPTHIPQWFPRPPKLPSEMRVCLWSCPFAWSELAFTSPIVMGDGQQFWGREMWRLIIRAITSSCFPKKLFHEASLGRSSQSKHKVSRWGPHGFRG